MALPIIILYEISILLSKAMYRKKEEKSETEET
jgi:Sec-independent protein secretion pathway component TatC